MSSFDRRNVNRTVGPFINSLPITEIMSVQEQNVRINAHMDAKKGWLSIASYDGLRSKSF